MRAVIFGKAMALDGDKTTTGATCISSIDRVTCGQNQKAALRVGDQTTTCPKCKQTGVVVTGQTAFMNHGKPQAVDGSIVQCGCSYGSNVVIAGEKPAMSRAFSPVSSENQYQRQQTAQSSNSYVSSQPAYAEQKEKDNRIHIDAQHLIDCADELCEKHLYYPDIKDAFRSQIEAFAYMIVNQVESGQKSYEQGSAELKKEEKSLLEQSKDWIINGLSIFGGVGMIWAGGALCSTGLGCFIGAPLIAHGANGIYEGALGLYEGHSDVQGPLREGYKATAKALGFSQEVGNLVYDLVDVGISIRAKLKLVPKLNEFGEVEKPLFLKKHAQQDLEKAYRQMKKKLLSIELVSDTINLFKVKDDIEKAFFLDKKSNDVIMVVTEPEKVSNVKDIVEDCQLYIVVAGDSENSVYYKCTDDKGNEQKYSTSGEPLQ
ncbi:MULTISPECIES: DUF4225 domain-containing protein [Providencia]|uniref:DUF4225 domain-containing protein n=1 Tax=Providencia TaxID=586 RepID=UPI0034E1CEE8